MVFVALQLSDRYIFETGSLVYTSVIIVLPLGTLVAQRVADPGAFNSEASRGGTKRGGNASDRYDASVTGKKPLLPSWRQSDNTCTVYSGHRGSKYGTGKTGFTSTVTSDRFDRRNSDAMREIDMELGRIDGDLEKGRVRVNREFQRSEEVL